MGPRLPDLVHLKDGRQELPQEGHVELVPCAAPRACRLIPRYAFSCVSWESP